MKCTNNRNNALSLLLLLIPLATNLPHCFLTFKSSKFLFQKKIKTTIPREGTVFYAHCYISGAGTK